MATDPLVREDWVPTALEITSDPGEAHGIKPGNSLGLLRGREPSFGAIEIAVGGLKLGLEPHLHLREVDQLPAREAPPAIHSVMGDAEKKMGGALEDLRGAGPGRVVEGAQG